MPIVGRADDDARLVEFHEWVKLTRFLLADDIEFEARVFSATFEVAKPLFFDFAESHPNTAGSVEARCLAGFLRQNFVIQLDRIIVYLGYGHIADEVRA